MSEEFKNEFDESKEISYSEIIKFELINEECIVMLKK